MEKVIRITKKTEKRSDFEYWQSRSYEERLRALESIRQEFILWKYGTVPGFQRVYSIVRRKPKIENRKSDGRAADKIV